MQLAADFPKPKVGEPIYIYRQPPCKETQLKRGAWLQAGHQDVFLGAYTL